MLGDVDLLAVNEGEAEALAAHLGTAIDDQPVPRLLVTRGARGARYREAGAAAAVEAFAVAAVDTTGAGDTFLGYFLAALDAAVHPGLDLLGLTTVFGNVPVATATRNALVLAGLAGGGIPVAEGAARPMVRAAPPCPDHVHGPEGLGDIAPEAPRAQPDHRPAARFLADITAARPGAVTLCAIGPLTNLAEALALDPGIAGRTAGVVVMGGAIACPGNATPDAETNIWCDPHAAAAVLGADWLVTLVGLDVTTRVTCSAADFAGLAAAAPRVGGFLARAARFYIRFHRARHGLDGCHMHDPAALVALTDPGLFRFREAAVRVTLDGPAAGRTEAEVGAGTPPVRIALDAEIESVRARFLAVSGAADARLGAG